MQTVTTRIPFRHGETWAQITNPDAPGVPLVVLHGGPGCTHDYVRAYADLADDRPVVHYDQFGNGRSTHWRDAPADNWTIPLFLDELDTLLAALKIEGRYALLGQSWGVMLATEHAVRRPGGLRGLVLANGTASNATWRAEAARLIDALPAAHREALRTHGAAGAFDHPAYRAASDVFYARHVCRVLPWPEDVAATFRAMADDPTVYHAMNGPTEFEMIGSFRDWTIEDRLPRIAVPALVLRGEHDEATAACAAPLVAAIPDSTEVVIPATSHMPHVEDRAATMAAVRAFLTARVA